LQRYRIRNLIDQGGEPAVGVGEWLTEASVKREGVELVEGECYEDVRERDAFTHEEGATEEVAVEHRQGLLQVLLSLFDRLWRQLDVSLCCEHPRAAWQDDFVVNEADPLLDQSRLKGFFVLLR